MEKDLNCAYCQRNELVEKFGYFVCDLKVSTIYLFKEQSHKGRLIVAYKDHVSEMVDISKEERDLFMDDVCKASNAIHQAFHPDKVNYGMYGDTGHHLHVHLCPKYKDGYEWGGVFLMNPGLYQASNEELEELKKELLKYLK